ncbi:MAG: hypothetical protein AB8B97_05305 [Granulosicoccus sp.]
MKLTQAPTSNEVTILNLLSRVQRFGKATSLSACVLIACIANPASAAQFGVRVVSADGMPVAGASVCFGLPGNYRQFGAVFTDVDGQAVVEVPNLPFVVTVSKTRFSGMRLSEPARGYNLIKQVTLAEGTPGPRCKAGTTLAEATRSSVRITNVQVSSDSRSTQLIPEATGEPTEYRVNATPYFDASPWKKLDESIQVSASMAKREKLYLQLRRYEGTRNGWFEARSETATVFLSTPESSL